MTVEAPGGPSLAVERRAFVLDQLKGQIPIGFAVLKAGAKLFLEAELEADDAVAEALVDAFIDGLLQAISAGSEEERKRAADDQIERFASRARRRAHRRGWNERDAKARYHHYMKKFERGIARAHHRAGPAQHAALAHASRRIAEHRTQAETRDRS